MQKPAFRPLMPSLPEFDMAPLKGGRRLRGKNRVEKIGSSLEKIQVSNH